jgi:microsomal dipeptidase-like Zn-dependent dipeptidase/anthranilate/para-aminobenzoate synthase component II
VFNLQEHLDGIYQQNPEGEPRPLIGITANYEGMDATLRYAYYNKVVEAGGIPVIIPPVNDRHVLVNTLDRLDALILTGGADINPLWCGEEPSPKLGHINSKRDLPELLITRLAYNRQIPMLGICRGIQTLAIALDGHVAQDIPSSTIKHSQDADRGELTHSVTLHKNSELYRLYGTQNIFVNSFHHQAVSAPGKRFWVTATAPDGTIEAIESTEQKSILGVQWHPEWLDSGLPVFKWVVRKANEFHMAKDLHSRIITLDTHCDTPMFFHQGIHFEQRDPRILVDMHKMQEGRQQAVTMVAYLPQPKIGETFSQKVDTSWMKETESVTPFAYANAIFDKIEDIVKSNSRNLSIARTPQDLYEDQRKGRRSIMLGIENALALGHDIQNVKHFAQRGIVYITLCHNGDNDVCDSARGCNTHNGVSQFGEKVINEMNRCGIMVDLSHAGEKSFYDALQISTTPIVCSHSNCRALCDHPRNLTDDQLRALAQAGGVAHTTLYAGFLRTEGEATILDAVSHLEHAIDVMGIDHVGIGTDFDGDGGVRGYADASEAIQFTLQLLRRHYSERDIQKIWGGNFLRVMNQVQQGRR